MHSDRLAAHNRSLTACSRRLWRRTITDARGRSTPTSRRPSKRTHSTLPTTVGPTANPCSACPLCSKPHAIATMHETRPICRRRSSDPQLSLPRPVDSISSSSAELWLPPCVQNPTKTSISVMTLPEHSRRPMWGQPAPMAGTAPPTGRPRHVQWPSHRRPRRHQHGPRRAFSCDECAAHNGGRAAGHRAVVPAGVLPELPRWAAAAGASERQSARHLAHGQWRTDARARSGDSRIEAALARSEQPAPTSHAGGARFTSRGTWTDRTWP